jgi:hypothetical protein
MPDKTGHVAAVTIGLRFDCGVLSSGKAKRDLFFSAHLSSVYSADIHPPPFFLATPMKKV